MIREKINNELANLGWSVRRLANETGVRYASLTEYLSNKRELSSKNLEIVFKALDLSIMKRTHKYHMYEPDLFMVYIFAKSNDYQEPYHFFTNCENSQIAIKECKSKIKKIFLDIHKCEPSFLEENHMQVIYKSSSKEMNYNEVLNNKYWIPSLSHHEKLWKWNKDRCIIQVEKWRNNEGWTDEMLQKEAEKHWKNNIPFSIRNYQTRID